MSELKVFRIAEAVPSQGLHGQWELIVAAPSRSAAVRAMRAVGAQLVTDHSMKTYGSITRDDVKLRVALGSPGTVFAAPRLQCSADEDFQALPVL